MKGDQLYLKRKSGKYSNRPKQQPTALNLKVIEFQQTGIIDHHEKWTAIVAVLGGN